MTWNCERPAVGQVGASAHCSSSTTARAVLGSTRQQQLLLQCSRSKPSNAGKEEPHAPMGARAQQGVSIRGAADA